MPESLNHADPTDKFSVIGTCHIRSGLLPSQCPFEVIRVGLARTDDFRSTPINRHRYRASACLKWGHEETLLHFLSPVCLTASTQAPLPQAQVATEAGQPLLFRRSVARSSRINLAMLYIQAKRG
jgi:hypothetical protein